MSFRTASLMLLLLSSAAGMDSSVWGPADSVHALDAVIVAVDKIAKNPLLAPEHLKRATEVAADIKKDIEAVEGGKLTKPQAHEKVGEAMKELMSFQAVFAGDMAKGGSVEAKMEGLKKQLAEKTAALKKVESMMKMLKLKKALAEKKLKLQNLINQKADSGDRKKAEQEELEKTGSMVEKLLAMTKNMTGVNKTAPLKTIAATLQAREHIVSESIAKVDTAQKNGDAQLDALVKSELQKLDKSADNSKQQKMFKHLKSEADRKFAKVRAIKKHELDEIKEAEQSTKNGDVVKLEKTLAKIQKETKTLQAKSGGGFLH